MSALNGIPANLSPHVRIRPGQPPRRVARRPIQNVVRLLIADDHTLFREALRTVLELIQDFKVVGEASDGEEAVALARRLKPDVLLLDLCMPRKSGMEVLRELSDAELPVRVVILTGAIAKSDTLRSFQLGARGVVLKSYATTMLIEGIRKVMAGEYWIAKESVANLIQATAGMAKRQASKGSFGLTPRENDIITAVLAGYSNPEIADKYSLSEQTVKHHLSHIFDKLGVYSRVELALFAVNHHLCGCTD